VPTFDVFVSYSSADRVWVETRLVAALDAAGLTVAVDFRTFAVGTPAAFNMETAVRDSRKVILVLTPDWINGQWTRWEFLIAQVGDPLNRARRILPLILRRCELPESLRVLTYQDLSGGGDLALQLRRVVSAVRDDAPAAHDSGPPSASSRGAAQFDLEDGLARMSERVKRAGIEAGQLDFLVLETRLRGNLGDERRFGSSEELRSDRARIVLELNRIAISSLRTTFNDLCLK
jgi:TIR domain